MTSRLTVPDLVAPAAAPAGLHPVTIPAPSYDGAPKEVAVLADLPTVKIVAITLRGGAKLAEHAAPVPVTIQAAHGAAILTVAGNSTPLGQGAFVVLDANTPHAVTPVDNAPVTVIVHRHKAGGQ